MDYKAIITAVAILIALGSYVPYFRDIYHGKTKPHAFSWLIWALLNWIAFAASILEGGGVGAWVIAMSASACTAVFLSALYKGETEIHRVDKLSLAAAGVAMLCWYFTSDPTISVILIALTDALGGFVPTFRKSFHHPYEETLSTYLCGSIYYLLSLFALESYSIATAFYPISIVLINSAFVIMLFVRRKQLGKSQSRE